MRVGIVRTDLGKGVYIADIESRSQRSFTHSPEGQARNIRRPTDAELTAILEQYPVPVSATGTDTNATVDTDTGPADTLRIRASALDAFTAVTVTQSLTAAKTDIRDELNAEFLANSLPFLASIVGTNQIRITSTLTGPRAYLEIDTDVLSTLNTPLGYAAGGVIVAGDSYAALLADLKTAVYPTSVTINVASATVIGANAGFALLSAPDQTALATAVADLVAPSLYETGPVLLSFASGIMSKLRAATYRPDGARVGLPTGIGLAAVEDDGSTPFTYP